MQKTKIEWCDSTWNPITGCLHDCKYCYARKIANRFKGSSHQNKIYAIQNCELKLYPSTGYGFYKNHDIVNPVKDSKENIVPYPFNFNPTFHHYRLNEPAKKTKEQNIFVCSMADLFGDWIPAEWIRLVWEACTKADWHNYLFLTKNPKRYREIYRSELDYRCYMWFGATVTDNNSFLSLGDELYQVTGRNNKYHAKRFLSIEPLHGEIDIANLMLCVQNFDWIIIGAETGNRKGKIIPQKKWIDSIVEECKEVNIPIFMKDSLIPIMGEENMFREFPEGVEEVSIGIIS